VVESQRQIAPVFFIANPSGQFPTAVALRYEIFDLRSGIGNNQALSSSKTFHQLLGIKNFKTCLPAGRLPIYSRVFLSQKLVGGKLLPMRLYISNLFDIFIKQN